MEGTKAVDILCITDDTVWLIEIKDYRKHDLTNETSLADVMFLKARDSITGLPIACLNGNDKEWSLSRMVFGRCRWKLVLHLEHSDKMTNMSSIYIAIQKKVRVIDCECVVMDTQTTHAVPWAVERINDVVVEKSELPDTS